MASPPDHRLMADTEQGDRPPGREAAREKAEKRRKALLTLFVLLALGNLPTLFRNPLEYVGALVLCFLLAVAVVRILY